MILGSFHMKLTIVDPPVAASLFVGAAKLGALEVIGKGGTDTGIALGRAGSEKNANQHRR
jgi:hypothetical protein